MPRQTPTIYAWMQEYNRIARIANERGNRVRILTNMRVANNAAQRRVQALSQRFGIPMQIQGPGSESPVIVNREAPSSMQNIPAPATETRISNIYDYTYGVELEFMVPRTVTAHQVAQAITAAGVTCTAESYSHATRRNWKIVSDASLSALGAAVHGLEAVSPVLRGAESMAQLDKVCDAIVSVGGTVNRTCGLHVHVGVSAMGDRLTNFFKKLISIYHDNEMHIDSILAPSRRGNANTYCHPITASFKERANAATTVQQIVTAAGGRYGKLNVQAYWRHQTVEFRHHQGTVDKNKVVAWTKLCLRMVVIASQETVTIGPQPNLLDFLTSIQASPEEVGYFCGRYAHFKSGVV